MNDYGLKISKPGYNVLTASGRELIYNSIKDYLFIQKEGIIRKGENHTVVHSLGYYPTAIVWADNASNQFYKSAFGDPNAGVLVMINIDNYQAQIVHGGSDLGDEVYYMIFWVVFQPVVNKVRADKTSSSGN